MRGKAMVCGLLLSLAVIGGCKQQCFLKECDYDHYRELTAQNLDCACPPGNLLPPEAGNVPPPPTVLDPNRPIRYLSLSEALAVALEQGNVGGPLELASFNFQGGLALSAGNIDIPLVLNGRTVGSSDAIRVFALDPAITHTEIE